MTFAGSKDKFDLAGLPVWSEKSSEGTEDDAADTSGPPPVLKENATVSRFGQESVGSLARNAGFSEAGAIGLPYAETDRDAARFASFIDDGRAGTMQYLAKRNEREELIRSRSEVPFPWAKSAVVCLASYHVEAPLSTEAAEAGNGWIARYAWSGKGGQDGTVRPADYHKFLMKRLENLEASMHAAYGDFECRAYVDTGPVVERSLARAAGVGWTGKNTCLIHPKLGSWNFLAVLVTSLELPVESVPLAVPDRCGSCRRCLEACPTQALIEPYQMDASRCISYLTIEHRGEIAEELMEGMGRQVFGCDICQDVCPWNRKAPIGPATGKEGDWFAREELVNPKLEWLASLEREDFERLFNGSPLRRTGFEGLRRNVAIAMANSGLTLFKPWLERWAKDEDALGQSEGLHSEPAQAQLKADMNRVALRKAAIWALGRLGVDGNGD